MTRKIAPNELGDLLRGDSSVKIIDVRTPLEHGEVHIAEADLHPLDQLSADHVTRSVGEDEPIYIVCRSGNRACKAIEKLEAAGFDRAVLVEGGMQAWEAVNLPVVRGRKVVSLERQVRIAAGSLVLLGAIMGFVTGISYWHGLSAFVGAGLVFAGVTDTCAMGMLMARMPWNRRQNTSSKSTTPPAESKPTGAATAG